jgi:hypothetical protein
MDRDLFRKLVESLEEAVPMNPSEAEFCAQFNPHYAVQRIARAVYRERYPSGMHTNGPMRVTLDVGLVQYLLTRWGKEKAPCQSGASDEGAEKV